MICRAHKAALSAPEEEFLAAWRRASPQNERYYQEWTILLGAISDVFKSEPEEAPPLIEDLIAPRIFEGRDPNRRLRLRLRMTAAGTLLCAAIAAALILPWRGLPGDTAFGTGEVVTGRSESTTVRLGDGSIVLVGPDSRLRIVGESGKREVWLEGRAFFAVAHDDHRPFAVRTHAGDAVVLGTRFDIRARDDDLQLLVVEGAVRVGARGGEIEIEENVRLTVSVASDPVAQPVDPDELQQELSWVGDFLVFSDTPLSRAAKELSERYDIPVAILDSTLARHTVTGVFADEDVQEVARILCQAVAAHCSVRDTGITIGR